MKKLKAVLILLLALVMSLALFACGGGKEENPGGDQPSGGQPGGDQPGGNQPGGDEGGGNQPGGDEGGGEQGGDDDEQKYGRFRLNPSSVTLTDSQDAAALQAELAKVNVTAMDLDGEPVELTLDGCDYDVSAVSFHEVGEYSFEVSPKDDKNTSATLTVVIEHDWQEEGNGVKVCQYDKARQVTKNEDVVIHYGTFHAGTGATLPADQWAETSVYTNKNTDSNISAFGSVNGRNVPTITAGKLEPGMTITIRGKAMTTTGESGPWGHENENWNSPSLGIADRYNNGSNSDHLGYSYGTSVIVRQEGWVLYNGIGEDDANTLGGIMGGFYESAGGWRNYGSHVDATDTTTPGAGQTGYVAGEIPTDWTKVNNWWVYSTGETHPSMSSFTYHADENGKPDISQAAEYEFTWNYREDGVIEITYTYTEEGSTSTLKAYIKVPDSSVGYYDTIIHGDYNDMTITESVVTTKRTPKNFRYNGLLANSNSVYAENKPFDAAALNVEVQYEQTGDTWNPLQVANGQIYYYLGTLTRDQLGQEANKAEFESTDPTKWACLGNDNSLKAGVIYKIHIDKGGMTWDQLIPATDFTVLPNRVDSAEGADAVVGEADFPNNGKLGNFTFSVDTTNRNIVLTLDNGYVQKLSDAQKEQLTGAANNAKYVAIRLNAASLGESFKTDGLTVKKGNTDVPFAAYLEDEDLYLVLALTEAGEYTVTGAQDTPIVLDLTTLKGFSIESVVTTEPAEGLALNKGGTITLTYTLPAGTTVQDLTLRVDGSPLDVAGIWLGTDYTVDELERDGETMDVGRYKVVSAKYVNTVLTLKLEVPAANYANYAPIAVELELKGKDTLVDYVDYAMTLTDADGYVAGSGDNGGNYAFVTESGKLNIIKAFSSADLRNGVISNSRFSLNVNNGDEENFKTNGLLTVTYSVVNGELVLLNAPAYVSGYVKFFGTYGDDRDTDLGAYVVITVDVSGLGITGDYYFEFVDGAAVFDPDEQPASVYQVSGTTLSSQSLASGYALEPFSAGDGNCYEEGLYAWAVKKDGNVVCYAGAAVAGGEHVDEDADGKCDLCGGTMTKETLPAWSASKQFTMSEGDIIDMVGTYVSSGVPTTTYGMFGPYVSIVHTHRYWLRTDGYYEIIFNDNWNTRGGVPYDEELRPDGEQTAGTSLVNNVLNGVVTLDGVSLDTVTVSSFAEWLAGKTVRYVVSYIGTTITIDVFYYNPDGSLSINYQAYVYDVNGTANLQFTCDPSAGLVENPTFTRSSAANSAIKSVESAAVDSHVAPTTVEYATTEREGTNVVLGLSGVAAKEGNDYYAAFKIELTQALVASTRVALVDAQGAAIANGKATLAENRESLTVYLPIAAGMQEAYLRFTNYEASTAQADIKIDLSNLIVSEITSALSGQDELDIGEGTFTVTYTGAVQDTDTLVIGGVSKAISELKTEAVSYGNGYSAKATVTATATTVEITKAAADLTKVVEGVEIRLERNGGLLAIDSVDPALTVTGGTELNDSAWYATANGAQLILFSNEGGSLYLNVNAGEATEAELVSVYNLSVNTNNGALEDTNNALAKVSKAVYSTDGETKLYVVVIDLTSFGVADKAYGYQAYVDSEAQNYYTVNAQRVISAATAPVTDGKETTELVEGSCIVSGVEAYATDDKTFYYNVAVTAANGHTWEEKADADKKGYDKVYECSNGCGALKYEQNSDETAISSSWGEKSGNKYLGWNEGLSWETFGILYKGGSYEITGANLSNQENVWEFPEPGLTDVEDTNADGFRLDDYVQDDNATLPWDNGKADVVYSFNDAKNPSFSYSFQNITTAVKDHLDGATITYTFDYTNADRIVITIHLVNGEVLDFTTTVTLTGDLADSYYLAFHADGNLYTASKVETVVPSADKEPATALSKHVHEWVTDSTKHKCEADNTLNPDINAHKGSFEKGVCSVCGYVCWHEDQEGTCDYCGATYADTPSTLTYTTATFGNWASASTLTFMTLAKGSTITLEATYENGGDSSWNGFVVQLMKNNAHHYFMRPAGDYANATWAWGTVNAGENVEAPGFTDAADYITAKKTAKTRVTVSLDEAGTTFTVKYELLGDSAATDTKLYTVTGLAADVTYTVALALDGATANGNIVLTGATGWNLV